MGLSRKNKRELKKLRAHATDLWQEQRDVLERASEVLHEATHQAKKLSNQHVTPRVLEAVDVHVRPNYDKGLLAARAVSAAAKGKLVADVLPVASTAVGSAVAAMDLLKDPRVQDTLSRAKKASAAATVAGRKLAEKYVPALEVKPAPAPVKSGIGAGGVVAITAGVVIAAGVGYAFWQTFRADDDLWIADDAVPSPAKAPTDAAPTTALPEDGSTL
jgi:hypothetical protein